MLQKKAAQNISFEISFFIVEKKTSKFLTPYFQSGVANKNLTKKTTPHPPHKILKNEIFHDEEWSSEFASATLKRSFFV